VIPVASIGEGLEFFAGELEAVIRELPELEGRHSTLTRICSARVSAGGCRSAGLSGAE
jgi:hypothetical protein